MMRILLGAFVLAAFVACGPGSGGDDTDETLATLTIDPATSEHLIVNGAAAHQAFTATLTFPGGTTKDVTATTVFQIDSGFGNFTANDLAISTAGKTAVYGTYGEKVANAQVIARIKDVRIDPSLPQTTPDWFTGPEDAVDAPTVVYPALDVVMPRNLGDFEVHWTSTSATNDIYEVSLKTEFTDVRVYVPGGNGVANAGPRPSWMAFQAAEWLAAVGLEGTITYQVRSVKTGGGTVAAGPARLVRLSNDAMEGGLYYWAAGAAAGGAYGIFRHDMAKPGQPAEEYLTTNQTAGRCIACHVLSRDGTRMAVTYDGGNGSGTLVDVGTKTAQPESAAWNFGTFSADGTQFFSVLNGVLTVRDSGTQAAMTTMAAVGSVSHPDLSVDGKKLVYVRSGGGADYSFNGGTIYQRSYDPVTRTFGAETQVVTDGTNNYYPSWSPDGNWIVFNRSDAGSYNALNASVWIVKADGTVPAFPLTNGNLGTGLTNSWARWAPFQQSTGTTREPLFWITVSTKRDFGTRLINTGLTEANKFPQLWMYAFYPDRVGTADPSTPAFRLPFQNLTSRNHIAQWTERVVAVQ